MIFMPVYSLYLRKQTTLEKCIWDWAGSVAPKQCPLRLVTFGVNQCVKMNMGIILIIGENSILTTLVRAQSTLSWRMTWILDTRVLSGSCKNYGPSKYRTECDQNTELVRYLNPHFRICLWNFLSVHILLKCYSTYRALTWKVIF